MSVRIELRVTVVDDGEIRLELNQTYPGMLTAYPALVAAVESIEPRSERIMRHMNETMEQKVNRIISETGNFIGFKTAQEYFASSEWLCGLDFGH